MFFGLVIPMWLTEGLKEYFGKVNLSILKISEESLLLSRKV
jgi:hypothetical protein